ncbi:MAG: hypothetical protein Roseis2KO_44070 [Roseivirga sp.]
MEFMRKTPSVFCLFAGFFFVLFSHSAFSQKDLDSLRALVPYKAGEEKVDLQNIIARQLLYHSHTEAEQLVSEIIRACDSLNYQSGKSLALVIRGTLYQFQSKFSAAKTSYEKAILLAEKVSNQEALAYGQLGLGGLYINKGELALAYENHISGLKSARTLEKPDLELTYLMNMGVIKQLLADYVEAERFLLDALVIAEEHQLPHRFGQVYGNLGIVELKRKNYGKSIEYQQQALTHFNGLKAYTQAAISLQNIGFSHAKLRESEKAISAYDQSLKLRLQSGDSLGYGRGLRYKGELFFETNRQKEAQMLLDRALRIARNFKNDVLISEIYELQFKSFEQSGNFQKALEAHKQYSIVKDSLTQRTNRNKIAELNSAFELEKLEDENILQARENEIQDLKITQQNQLLAGAIVLLFLVAIWGVLRRKQLRNRLKLTEKDHLIAQKEIELRASEFEADKLKLIQYANQLLSKNQKLEEKKQHLESKLSDSAEEQREIDNLIERLRSTIHDEKDWAAFRLYFDALFPGFFEKLNQPLEAELTMYEQRLVALIKISLSNKEIGGILNISRNSVVRAKHRLRQRFGYEDTRNFESYIVNT